jgi:hypothetical protein
LPTQTLHFSSLPQLPHPSFSKGKSILPQIGGAVSLRFAVDLTKTHDFISNNSVSFDVNNDFGDSVNSEGPSYYPF